MTIGERIKMLRSERGWSQEELAKKLGYQERSIISLVELGKRGIDTDTLIRYADLFGVTPTYLLGWENKNLSDSEIELIQRVAGNEHTKQMLLAYAEKLKDVIL